MVKLLAKFQTRLNGAIDADDTSVIVDSVTDIPAVPFMAVIGAGSSAEEAVLVTAVTTATKSLTVTRAQRSTTAVAHGDHQLFHHSEIEWSDIKQTETFSAAGHGLHVEHTFTLATSGALKSLQIEQTYQPASGGYATPIPIVGKVTLGEDAEFTGGQGAMYGVQGQLHFADGATLNNASSVFAGLRGIISKAGTPVFTAFDTIACIYCDNLCATDMHGVGAKGSALASFQNHGAWLDSALVLRGNNKITNLLQLITFGGGCIGNGAKSGSGKYFACLIDGVTHYLNFYT